MPIGEIHVHSIKKSVLVYDYLAYFSSLFHYELALIFLFWLHVIQTVAALFIIVDLSPIFTSQSVIAVFK